MSAIFASCLLIVGLAFALKGSISLLLFAESDEQDGIVIGATGAALGLLWTLAL